MKISYIPAYVTNVLNRSALETVLYKGTWFTNNHEIKHQLK